MPRMSPNSYLEQIFPTHFKFGHLFLWLSLLCVQASAVSAADVSHRIIGGKEVTPNKYPWTVALISKKSNQQFCGGSLFADRWVMTAAHCLENTLSTEIKVYIGGNVLDRRSDGEEIDVEGAYGHREFVHDHDIALLKLAKPATKGGFIKLATKAFDDSLTDGTVLTVAGWGLTNSGANALTSNELLEVNVPLRNRAQCVQNYQNTDQTTITTNMLCAGGEVERKDSCNGDSGGPLFARDSNNEYQLLGVVAFGSSQGCATPALPGIYQRVSRYHDWTQSVMQGLLPLDSFADFGFVGENLTKAKTVTFANNGGTDKTVQGLNIQTDASFRVTNDQCTGKTLKADESCQVTIQVQSTQIGDQNTTLDASIAGSSNTDVKLKVSVLARDNNIGDAIEAKNLAWFNGGDASWASRTVSPSTGGNLAQTGSISHGQISILMTEFNSAGTLSFDWQTDTEEFYDKLELRINDEVIDTLSGKQALKRYSRAIPSGKHTVSWAYVRDQADDNPAANQHWARIDNVKFETSASPSEPNKPTPQPSEPNKPTPQPSEPKAPSSPAPSSSGGGSGSLLLLAILSLVSLRTLARHRAKSPT